MKVGPASFDPNIRRVYFATLVLGLAYGMAISLIAIVLDGRGFSKGDIGSLAAWFAGGIIAFSLPAGALIRAFSAKWVLTASLFGYALTVTSFPFLESYAALAAVRFLDGACSVGIWVSSETILIRRSRADNKAFVTSLYAITIALGYVVGPVVARGVAELVQAERVFVLAGVLSLVACAYVLLRLERDRVFEPNEPSLATGSPGTSEPAGENREAELSAARLLLKIRSSCFATFVYGYFQASVVLFLPLYLIESKGVERVDTIVIPAFFAAGMLLFANVAGRLGDRFGHLMVMRNLAIVGTVTITAFVFFRSFEAMCASVFVAGASLASISPVSLALQGIVAPARDLHRATAIYNAFYAAGMLLGPPISSALFEHGGGAFMLFHLAGMWASFAVFALVFQRDDPRACRVPRLAASES